MRATFTSILRLALAAFLLFAAAMKIRAVGVGVLPLSSPMTLPYLVVTVFEVGLALLLLRRPTAHAATWVILGGFAGSGLYLLFRLVAFGAPQTPCRCLGSLEVTAHLSLLVHGCVIVAGAAFVALSRGAEPGAGPGVNVFTG